MVEYATHVVRVKGQWVRASLGFRPEGQTGMSHLMRSRNIDILFPTRQTETAVLIMHTLYKKEKNVSFSSIYWLSMRPALLLQPCQANLVIS